MKTFLKYTLLTLLWGGVAAYIVYAAISVRAVRSGRKVRQVDIEVVDSTSRGHLVSSAMVRSWIAASGIATVGTAVDGVQLARIEELIARNGFVDEAVAYVTYSGTLYITISQRKPLVRLLLDGVDCYACPDGYVFAAPRASSLYVPVVTGSYRPPFATDYTGTVRAYVDRQKQQVEERIAQLEKEKYPFYKRELQNDRNILALRRQRVKKRWWRGESAAEFDVRVDALRKEKVVKRRGYRYEAKLIQDGIDALTRRQQAERQQQKKLEKSYEDFMKLLTFVKFVENDDFWRSEVVQIAAYSTPSGALEIELVPRSGRHTVVFGRLERFEEKFDKLLSFYRNGLSGVGWNEYRTIDIRYKDQVVCKK